MCMLLQSLLQLLLPLTKSKDVEVQRLAAHALANLSVNSAFPVGRNPSAQPWC